MPEARKHYSVGGAFQVLPEACILKRATCTAPKELNSIPGRKLGQGKMNGSRTVDEVMDLGSDKSWVQVGKVPSLIMSAIDKIDFQIWESALNYVLTCRLRSQRVFLL
jgi:hypothetical protein